MCRESGIDVVAEVERATVTDLAEELSSLILQARFFGRGHRVIGEGIDLVLRICARLRSTRGGGSVTIGCADGLLFADSRPLLRADRAAQKLRPFLESLGAGGITLEPECKGHDLHALLGLAECRKPEALGVAGANRELAANGSRGIRILPPYAETASGDSGRKVAGAGHRIVTVAERVYEGLFDHLTEVMLRLVRGELHFLDETRAHVEQTLSRLSEDAASVFDTMERETSRSDVFQFRHSIRVGCLALEFARALTDDRELLLRLGTAALLHDVGKREVPPEVLRHPGRLTGEMLEAMRQHPRNGARLLLRMPDSDPLAVAIAFCHHRRSDGGGYPESVSLAELSIATHIVKICDVYEALTAERPYKPRMTPRRAYRVMISMPGQLDPALLHRFIDVVGVWPVGERVRLRSGAVGRVVAQTGRYDRPMVRLAGEDDPVDLCEAPGDDLGPVVEGVAEDLEARSCV